MGALPERKPWLSSFLSSSCALEQSHTEASQVDTTKGKKRRFFHSEKTSVIASAVFLPGLSSALVLDLTQTQKKNYGFDAISLEGEYALLSDLSGDVVSITGGGVLLFSPSSRICDLSSQNHSPLEVRAHLTIGKEFGYKGAHFYRAAGACRMGKGTRGAAWVGGDAFIQHVFKETHYTSLFFESEHGLSSKRLSSIDHFRGWATVGYTFGDIGLRYEFSHNWLAVFYSEARMRLFAHDALSKVWSVKLGIQFPLSLI
jgi:hypothetical protein